MADNETGSGELHAASLHPSALDSAARGQVAKLFPLSPIAMTEVMFDWAAHFWMSPGKQQELLQHGMKNAMLLSQYVVDQASNGGQADPAIKPARGDRRFTAEDWQHFPFNVLSQAFLLNQEWWQHATHGINGVSKQNERAIQFFFRQALDRWSPSNFAWTNPEVISATMASAGRNLTEGARNFLEDSQRQARGEPPVGVEAFKVGEHIARTPGEVVFRNDLFELIQYAPQTKDVRPEPVLIVPAWIMKYYILDLSEHNSLINWLVGQGHTVFCISWQNPTTEDRNRGLDDYRRLGVMEAIRTIETIKPKTKIHAMGYCLGGTILAIAASAMAREGDDRLASMIMLAAQTDFTEAGELMLFIHEAQVAHMEAAMRDRGYLDGKEMAGAFQYLRSNDLIYSRLVREYLLGERSPINDLMAWNADLTRMPYRMHSEYLRKLFLNNDFAAGRFEVDGRPINFADVRVPIFAVGTEQDHVAPWRSVYKLTFHPATDVTFILTNGGHNAGIVSEPGHKRRRYRKLLDKAGAVYVDPDTWFERCAPQEGSWWPELKAFLDEYSGEATAPPTMGAPKQGVHPLGPAPGTYVLQR